MLESSEFMRDAFLNFIGFAPASGQSTWDRKYHETHSDAYTILLTVHHCASAAPLVIEPTRSQMSPQAIP